VRAKKGVNLVQIKIFTRHGHISEETNSRITEKLEKLPRIYDRITAIELTVDLDRSDMVQVDLKVSAKHKPDFLAFSASGNLFGSIDQVLEKMEQQLRKHKGKVEDRHRSPGHRTGEPAGEYRAEQ
jgi:putative sigma-54 modulation protein